MGVGKCQTAYVRYLKVFSGFEKKGCDAKKPDPYNAKCQQARPALNAVALSYVKCRLKPSRDPSKNYQEANNYYSESKTMLSSEQHPTVQAARHVFEERAVLLIKSKLKGKNPKDQYGLLKHGLSYPKGHPIQKAAEKLVGPVMEELVNREMEKYNSRLNSIKGDKSKYFILSSLLNSKSCEKPAEIALKRLAKKYLPGAVREKAAEILGQIRGKSHDEKITYLSRVIADPKGLDISKEAAKRVLAKIYKQS